MMEVKKNMRSNNFEIRKVVKTKENSTTSSDVTYEAFRTNGYGLFSLNYDEFVELITLGKNFLDCWIPDTLLYSDDDLIQALKIRGYTGKLTKIKEVEL